MAENTEEEIMEINEDYTSSAKAFREKNIGVPVGGSFPFMEDSPQGIHTSLSLTVVNADVEELGDS